MLVPTGTLPPARWSLPTRPWLPPAPTRVGVEAHLTSCVSTRLTQMVDSHVTHFD
jgi:hypothetical protein